MHLGYTINTCACFDVRKLPSASVAGVHPPSSADLTKSSPQTWCVLVETHLNDYFWSGTNKSCLLISSVNLRLLVVWGNSLPMMSFCKIQEMEKTAFMGINHQPHSHSHLMVRLESPVHLAVIDMPLACGKNSCRHGETVQIQKNSWTTVDLNPQRFWELREKLMNIW